jgi:hypothetical protein
MAKAKGTSVTSLLRRKPKKHGRHGKKKQTFNKRSKNYVKKYRGQGR